MITHTKPCSERSPLATGYCKSLTSKQVINVNNVRNLWRISRTHTKHRKPHVARYRVHYYLRRVTESPDIRLRHRRLGVRQGPASVNSSTGRENPTISGEQRAPTSIQTKREANEPSYGERPHSGAHSNPWHIFWLVSGRR